MAERSDSGRSFRGTALARLLVAVSALAGASIGASMGAGPAAAAGTATVQLSSTSATATEVTYEVAFTSPGSLSNGSGTITLSAPAKSVFSGSGCDYTIYDATTTRRGGCLAVTVGSGGTSVTVTTNVTVAAGNSVVVTAEGTTNASKAGSHTLGVTTSSGGTFKAPFTLTAATSVTGLALTATSTSAGASDVTDTLSFTATNGMTSGVSQVVLAGAAGSVYSTTGCLYSLYDSKSERTTQCFPVTVSSGKTVTMTPEITISAGDPLELTVRGVSNPATPGSDSVSLRTTSDPVSASAPFDVTSATAVSNLSLKTSAAGAGATAVTDDISFVPSNGITAGTSKIVVAVPAGSSLSSNGCYYIIENVSTKHSSSCGSVTLADAGTSATITTGESAAAGQEVLLTVEDLANPASKETGVLSLSTTSDPTQVSVPDDITAATSVKDFSVSANAHARSATGVTYLAKFTATSGLTPGTSQITFSAPSGSVLPTGACGYYVIDDLTTGGSSGCLSPTVSSNVVTVTNGVTVKPGNSVELVVNDATNGNTSAKNTVTLATTSDTAKVSSSLALTAATKVKDVHFTANDASADALRVNYSASFTVVGGLNPTFGRISITAPAGAVLPASGCGSYEVIDDTTGQSNGCLSTSVAGDSATIQAGVTVNPGDEVTVAIHRADNPPKSGKDAVKVSTSSDSTVASAGFQVKPEIPLKDVTLTPSSHAAGAKGVTYTITFVVTTAALTSNTSTVTVTATTGATTVGFPTQTGCGEYTDLDTTTGTGWSCAHGTPSTTGTSVTFTPDENGYTGNTFTITINNVTNPDKVGSAVFKIHSSFDPKPVKVTLSITAPTAVKHLSFKPTSFSATATEVTYETTFVATGGLTQQYSTITVSAPTGVVLPSNPGCGTYYVTDTTDGQSGSCDSVSLAGASSAVIKLPINVRPGDAVSVTIYGVANPTAAGDGSVGVSTSSDMTTVSTPFKVTAKSRVSTATLAVTGTSAPFKTTIDFTAKNGLTYRYSTITVTAPAGTDLPSNGCDYSVTDTTDSDGAGCPSVESNGATAIIVLPVTIRPGDSVQVVVDTVTGTKPSKMTVSTSSDPTTVSA